MGIRRVHDVLRRQLQGTDEGGLQLREEMQRSPQESHAAPDGLAAGQAGNGLVHHGLENGGGQIRPGSPVVDQGLDIRFGKHAAAGGDGIDLFILLRGLVQSRRVHLQQGGHLIDEGAGAAGADAVHPLIQSAPEVDDLAVLAPQFDGHVRLGPGGAERIRHRHHLLDEGDPQGFAQPHGAGAGDAQPQGAGTQPLRRQGEQLPQGLLGLGMMTAVFPEYRRSFLVQDGQLHRGGAHVDAGPVGAQVFLHLSVLYK